jgi:hypothetical protein
MVSPGHIAGGYLAAKALLYFTHPELTANQTGIIYAITLLSSEGPDLDLVWFYLVHKFNWAKDTSHRDYATHAPFGLVCYFSVNCSLWLLICFNICPIYRLGDSSRFLEPFPFGYYRIRHMLALAIQ